MTFSVMLFKSRPLIFSKLAMILNFQFAVLLLVPRNLMEWSSRLSKRYQIAIVLWSDILLLVSPILLWLGSTNSTFSHTNRPLHSSKFNPPKWISAEFESNYTSKLLSKLEKVNGTEPCQSSRTTNISIIGLDDMALDPPVKFVAGEIYEFVITTRDENGGQRCSGGDYFETDLSSENWKSRPPVKDHGDGTYSFSFQIHPDFAAGDYNLTIYLLFRSYEGLTFPCEQFAYIKEMRRIPIDFHYKRSNEVVDLPTLPLCQLKDFTRDVWTGRWTRRVWNDECNASVYDGRYRCIDQSVQCVNPWCQGQVGLLESNGWSYSAHCSFHIYTQDEAWRCLNGKYLFFWGDSNHRDTIRNLVNFVLGHWEVNDVWRRFYNVSYVNPRNSSESVRMTEIFNGHFQEWGNSLGLDSLLKSSNSFRDLIRRQFTGDDFPDVLILNSGLHDGTWYNSTSGFAKAADYAVDFWGDIFQSLKEKNGTKFPAIFYRTTVAAAGYARVGGANPMKMEAYNNIMAEKIKRKGFLNNIGSGFVDDFDMTFPFHYDLRHNDGIHYGRPATKEKWHDGEVGQYHYFVDLMLIHVLLLNAVCHDQQQQW